MMLKLARLMEEDIEVASVPVSSLESSVSCEELPAEEHDKEVAPVAPSSESPGSGVLSFIIKLKQSTPEPVREASKKLP